MFLQTVNVILIYTSWPHLIMIRVQVLTVLSFTTLVAADIVQSLQKLQARDYPDQYTLYLGDGSTNDGWPSMDQWYALLDAP
jgi:hypothetical protein